MNKMKKGLAAVAFVAVTACAIAGNVSAVQYGDNVITDAQKYNVSTSLSYDVNTDGYFNILDLVRVKKAAAGVAVDIDKSALGLNESDTVQAAHIIALKQALLSK